MELHNEAQRDADGAFMNGTLPTSSNIFSRSKCNFKYRLETITLLLCCKTRLQPVQGSMSKMGTYYGNTSTNGVFNYCGFKPAWVLIKCYTGANDSWIIIDSKRNTVNSMNARLFPDLPNAESTSQDIIDCLSNGFKLRTADTAYNGGRNYLMGRICRKSICCWWYTNNCKIIKKGLYAPLLFNFLHSQVVQVFSPISD